MPLPENEGGADATDLAQRCADAMYAEDRASRELGITVHDVAPGRAVARMRVTGSMVNGHGIAHGGYLFLLADTAFAFACNTYDAVTVAQGAQVTFLRPGKEGDELSAEAVERARFGRGGIYDVTVRTADGTVIAEFRGQSQELRGKPIL